MKRSAKAARCSSMVERMYQQSPFRLASSRTFGSSSLELSRKTNDSRTVARDAIKSKKCINSIDMSQSDEEYQKLTFDLAEFDKTM